MKPMWSSKRRLKCSVHPSGLYSRVDDAVTEQRDCPFTPFNSPLIPGPPPMLKLVSLGQCPLKAECKVVLDIHYRSVLRIILRFEIPLTGIVNKGQNHLQYE